MGKFGWPSRDRTLGTWHGALTEVQRRHIRWIGFVAFYTIVANLPYWIASQEFGFTNLGWFCVQYPVVGLIALVAPRIVSAFLLFAVIIADLLCAICISYYLPVRECLRTLTLRMLSLATAF